MKIDNHEISNSSRVFIIAELSANHNQNLDVAIETIRAAKRAGADCIKLQTYTPDTLTLNSRKDDFMIKGTIWSGKSYYELYGEAFTPWEWHKKLFEVAKEEGLSCFSSPFDKSAVDFLENLSVPAYKIASFEITDIPLIRYVASKQKPIIISTGIATREDIELAIKTCHDENNFDIALLKCTSSYPAPIQEANLSLMKRFKEDFNVLIGLSDHTLSNTSCITSTILGGKIIEKHFILDRSIGGPDAEFSLDFNEFKAMVAAVRETEQCLGDASYELTEKQKSGRVFSRSLYITKEVKKGDILNANNIKSVRPGLSLHPKYYEQILGKRVKKNLEAGDRITLDDIDF